MNNLITYADRIDEILRSYGDPSQNLFDNYRTLYDPTQRDAFVLALIAALIMERTKRPLGEYR